MRVHIIYTPTLNTSEGVDWRLEQMEDNAQADTHTHTRHKTAERTTRLEQRKHLGGNRRYNQKTIPSL